MNEWVKKDEFSLDLAIRNFCNFGKMWYFSEMSSFTMY